MDVLSVDLQGSQLALHAQSLVTQLPLQGKANLAGAEQVSVPELQNLSPPYLVDVQESPIPRAQLSLSPKPKIETKKHFSKGTRLRAPPTGSEWPYIAHTSP